MIYWAGRRGYCQPASETQQLSCVADACWPHPSVMRVELLGHSRQPVTGRLATHPSINLSVEMYIVS